MNEHPFSLHHYFTVVERLKKEFILSRFSETVAAGKPRLFLRHDIDYTPQAALKLAQKEAQRKIFSTYFVLLESPFYNPLEKENLEAIREIQRLGHSIGLHFSTESTRKEEIEHEVVSKFKILESIVTAERVVSFHFAQHEIYHSQVEFDHFLNAYGPRFFMKGATYLSDSNQRWKEGCPCQKKFADGKDLQLLTHPIWWVYDIPDPNVILKRLLEEGIEKRKRIMQNALPGSNF